MDIIRKEIMPDVWLSCLETDKFKSDCLSINLLTQLDRGTISKNALLPRVLLRGTIMHPDMDSINAVCDELYGARVIPCVRKHGEILAMGFYAGFIPERFTPDHSKLLEPVTALLGELLLFPATKGGLLKKEYVESEKQKLIDDIRSIVNDKRYYATSKAIENMCAYEDYGCDEMGSEESAAAVNYIDLTRHYRNLLQTCPIEIFYCGSSNAKKVEYALKDALATLPRGEIDYEIGTDIRMNSITEDPRYFTEELDVTQGKLVMGWRLGQCMEEPDFAAIRVFNALYGSGVSSKLFLNVREKLSLCYYASSSVDRHKGIMLVSSGINFDKYDEAKNEILAQLQAVKDGDFSDADLNSAKQAVASGLLGMMDSPGSLESYYLSQTLLGLDYSPEECATLCEETTREDILSVASGLELDTVYFLKGYENEEEDCEEVCKDD